MTPSPHVLSHPLTGGWSLLGSPPDAFAGPEALPAAEAGWTRAIVPGTVAQSLALGPDDPLDLDGRDWWYRCVFPVPAAFRDLPLRLRFDGLATYTEAWLDGVSLLSSRNMFRPRTVALPASAAVERTLVLCFRSLRPEPARRPPRPRWKTALVERQDLRWIRTSLGGRMPGWWPRLPCVGPWRGVTLEAVPTFEVARIDVHPMVVDGIARLEVAAELLGAGASRATLFVGDRAVALGTTQRGDQLLLSGDVALPGVALWWPHTHGEPHLHACRIVVDDGVGETIIDLGRIGFRALTFDRAGGQVRLMVNGRPVFCQGACWSGVAAPEQLADTLALVHRGGLNMLRIGGTMVYGSDELYTRCDALGILVWQDFMFANLDYPFGDDGFRAEVEAEVVEQLRRLQRHASVAVYCGGSEIEQQAAMLGLPASDWRAAFLDEALPAACAALHPGVPYVPGTPSGGPLPFHTSVGLSHYYGVGAYRRPLSDARLARVRFTAECLGFANVPDEENLALLPTGADTPPHHPTWKAGVPRDNGAGWDFDDIRDHYLGLLYGVDPVRLRGADPERYRALSRAVTGELMLRTYAEWRRPESGCGGALVWFLQDLRAGAGWGVLDSAGRPKAAWWALKRAWAGRAVLLTDEGLDGVDIHVHNEAAAPLDAVVELSLIGATGVSSASTRVPVHVEPWDTATLSMNAVIGTFMDVNYVYRFGPARYEVVLAQLRVDGEVVHGDALFPLGHTLTAVAEPGLSATVAVDAEGDIVVTLVAARFLQGLHLSSPGFTPDDNHFHLAPGVSRTVGFTREGGQRGPFKAWIGALNTPTTLTVRGP